MKKENIKKIITGICVFLIFEFAFLFKYIPMYLFNISINQIRNDRELVVLISFFISLMLTFIFLIIYRKELIEEWKIMKKDISQNFDTGLIYWAIGLVIMIASNIFLQYVLKIGQAKNETAIQEYIQVLPLLMGIDICILAPIYEEIIFRKAIRNIFIKPYFYIPASFIIFGAVHITATATTWTDWLYIIPYGSLGGAFAYSYYKTNTIYTSITFHMIHNTTLFLLSIIPSLIK